jgi:hypothetical protein
MGIKGKNEVGNRYGRLTVITEVDKIRGARSFKCECDCGNKEYIVTGCDLRSGRVNSCGCYKSEKITKENTTHGLKQHRIYKIYYNMIARCYNDKTSHFKDYGGRGITICDEWLGESGFVNFYDWSMKNGYSNDLSIDRIEVNGNYEPNNCRWATNEEQANNKRKTIYIEINGETKTLKQWCEFYNLNYNSVRYRIKSGWNKTLALTTPIKRVENK